MFDLTGGVTHLTISRLPTLSAELVIVKLLSDIVC